MKKDMVTVARACRLEFDKNNNDVYIVFKIIDEDFKKRVRENWEKDYQLEMANNNELFENRS